MLTEPSFKSVPSVEDYYYDSDCDERWAIKTYLGKDIEYAKNRYFKYSPLMAVHDFDFVGTKAFRYYIFGAFRYLQEVDKNDEYEMFDAAEVFCALTGILNRKLDEDLENMRCITDYIFKFCSWAIENYDVFDINEEIYGDVKEQYRCLAEKAKEI